MIKNRIEKAYRNASDSIDTIRLEMFDYLSFHSATTIEAFLKGYRRVRPLPTDDEKYIEPFMAAYLLMVEIWMAGISADSPMHRARAPEFVKFVMNELKDFLNR